MHLGPARKCVGLNKASSDNIIHEHLQAHVLARPVVRAVGHRQQCIQARQESASACKMHCLRRDDDSTAIEHVARHVCAHHGPIERRNSLVSGPEDKAHVPLERRPKCACHGVQLQNCHCTHGALQAMGFAEHQGLAVEKLRSAQRNVLEMPKQPRLAAKSLRSTSQSQVVWQGAGSIGPWPGRQERDLGFQCFHLLARTLGLRFGCDLK